MLNTWNSFKICIQVQDFVKIGPRPFNLQPVLDFCKNSDDYQASAKFLFPNQIDTLKV